MPRYSKEFKRQAVERFQGSHKSLHGFLAYAATRGLSRGWGLLDPALAHRAPRMSPY